jgi:hypothetical protein
VANWSDVLREINHTVETHQRGVTSAHDTVRRRHLAALAAQTGRNTIAYYSAFLASPALTAQRLRMMTKMHL